MKYLRLNILLILLIVFISACTSGIGLQPEKELPQPSAEPKATATITLTSTLRPVAPTPTPELIQSICSPLFGESFAELPDIKTRDNLPSRAGFDEGHPGLDFSFFRRKDRLSIDGLPVLTSLDGVVSTILNERLPYGHAIIIETPLDSISEELLAKLDLPEIQPTVMPDPKFNCVPPDSPVDFSSQSKSIYILYSHLKNPVSLTVGENVVCGQTIGEVGDSGKEYSTNPHLHFETRIGPSGVRFESMAYYTADSTQSERYNYCVWRVSNLFQLFDPMKLLSIQE